MGTGTCKAIGFCLLVGCVALSTSTAGACSIPVFRYALERWPADPYEVFVFHRGPLSSEEQATLERLEETAEVTAAAANVRLERVDLDAEPDPAWQELWEAEETQELPWMVVRTPQEAPFQAQIWSGRLDDEAVQTVVDSPVRREAARRILQGESAVWVLLESGIPEKDDAAAEVLETELKRLQGTLQLPEQGVPGLSDADSDAEDSIDADAELRLAFSLLRVSRDDPAEQAFVAMLLETEDDLKEFDDQPMAFPIFGRGRALYALVGRGINETTIQDACEFMIGPCSCQVKDLNPGADLLMAAAWDDLIGERIAIDKELPPLTGIPDLAALSGSPEQEVEGEEVPLASAPESAAEDEASAGAVSAPAAGTDETEPASSGTLLGRNLLIVTLLGLLVVVGATVVLTVRKA